MKGENNDGTTLQRGIWVTNSLWGCVITYKD
jgi:hypothetical protein